MAQQTKSTLSNVTLTMIVRDELMNPAGGLHAVLSCHLPYFENVVVLDTGSIDGTRQLLEQMASEYPQLRVYDAEFIGYGPARNKANEYVTTKYTFMLDADEKLVSPQEFVEEVRKFEEKCLSLKVVEVDYFGCERLTGAGLRLRLFQSNLFSFRGTVFEEDEQKTNGTMSGELIYRLSLLEFAKARFFHFLPMLDAFKDRDWYRLFRSDGGDNTTIPPINPSQATSYFLWKTPNPVVLRKYGVNVLEEIKYLEGLGLQLHPRITEVLSQAPKREFEIHRIFES